MSKEYQLMRFNILSSPNGQIPGYGRSQAYLYAWSNGVFPIFDEFAEYHEPFSEDFKISKARITGLAKLFDDYWMENKKLTFYELESVMKDHKDLNDPTRWPRWELIIASRYMYLSGRFDTPFWNNLLTSGECPSEAFVISDEFRFEFAA